MFVSISEAKARLSRLIAEVVIRRHNVPVAKLVPFRPLMPPRRLGGWEGQVDIAHDFDELPEELAAAFGGEDR